MLGQSRPHIAKVFRLRCQSLIRQVTIVSLHRVCPTHEPGAHSNSTRNNKEGKTVSTTAQRRCAKHCLSWSLGPIRWPRRTG